MNKRIEFVLILVAFILFAISFLTSCATFGVSLQTDYGKFTYELPMPEGTKK
jgi:hypothetical protein